MPWPAPMRAASPPAPSLPEVHVAPSPASPSIVSVTAPRPVQRAVEIPELNIKSTVADPPKDNAPAGEHDPDQLHEQVIRWIRAELLVNRERTGRLTDLR
jgi:hypothetical protein